MDRRYEIERYVLTESRAKDEKTFLYQLHENSFFDKNKFNTLLSNCDELANEYISFGKSGNYIEVTKGIFIIFEHMFFLLFNHFAEEDHFTIQNYDTTLTADDISDYYFQIRMITQKIIF